MNQVTGIELATRRCVHHCQSLEEKNQSLLKNGLDQANKNWPHMKSLYSEYSILFKLLLADMDLAYRLHLLQGRS